MLYALMPPTYLSLKRECVVRIEKKLKSLKLLESELRLAVGAERMGACTADGGAAQPAPKRHGVTPAAAARMARRKNLPLPAQSAALVTPVTVPLRSSLAKTFHCHQQ